MEFCFFKKYILQFFYYYICKNKEWGGTLSNFPYTNDIWQIPVELKLSTIPLFFIKRGFVRYAQIYFLDDHRQYHFKYLSIASLLRRIFGINGNFYSCALTISFMWLLRNWNSYLIFEARLNIHTCRYLRN